MIFKNKDGKTIKTDNKNLISMLEREGFKQETKQETAKK